MSGPEMEIEAGPGIEIVKKIERNEENDWLNDAIAAIMAQTRREDGREPTPFAVTTAVNLLTGLGIDFAPAPSVMLSSPGGLVLEWKVGNRELEIEVMSQGGRDPEWLKNLTKDDGSLDMASFEEGVLLPIDREQQARALVEWVMGK